MDDVREAKRALRRAHLLRRRQRPPAAVAAAGEALAHPVLGLLPEAPARVAAHIALPGEPPTAPLLAALAARGHEVLLPVLLDDGDLDWAALGAGGDGTDAAGDLVPGRAGTLAPEGPRLGPGAVASVAAVVLPGVAGDTWGGRLGRGGGSYDRALARVPPGVPTLLLLHDDEVVARVPAEGHDRLVTHVVTPERVLVARGRAVRLD